MLPESGSSLDNLPVVAPKVHHPLYSSFMTLKYHPYPSRQEAYVIKDYPLNNVYMLIFLGIAFANFQGVTTSTVAIFTLPV